ncbi:MAG TPA: hypothetical protein VKX49_04985 [Bryobacteraceae bacterium]|nr:hypothetical protein [Bryobacteraceae bacterium]
MKILGQRRSWIPLACFLAAAVLFYFANRAAYKGYFSDDDLVNLTWPTFIGNDVYIHGLLSVKTDIRNFRPVGDLYYRYLYRAFHLYFPAYVIALQLLHALNVLLVYLLLRELLFSSVAAGVGAVFYLFHAAVVEIYWKPMFIFDLLCATLCLAALLLYIRGHWLLGLIPFWLAYKSKEVAVMLPIAFVAWELWIGKRRWKRLVPYLVISLNFGLQAIWINHTLGQGNPYLLNFSFGLLAQTISFYSAALFFNMFAGMALLLLPIWLHDRRLYLGLVVMISLMLPLLLLPGRQLTVYWYTPMIGVAMVVAAVATRTPRWALAMLLVLWCSWNYLILRQKRPGILAEGARDRALVTALRDYSKRIPPVRAVVYENIPDQIHSWGVDGAINQVFGAEVQTGAADRPEGKQAMGKLPMALIRFTAPPLAVQGLLRTNDGAQPYIRFTELVPEWQLGTGWYDQGSRLRWTMPRAELILHRPEKATAFEVLAGMSPGGLDRDGPAEVSILEDGKTLGVQTLSQVFQTLRWNLPAAAAGDKHISIVSKPARQGDPGDPRILGIAVQALGYTPF